ncbi:aluminum-activated malate transporter 10-like [Iris pallida]|uniref:Aluminum-activated malate transporter 10-like n=1 Tax=Iris pallida TaxID=29817 RepID=A0AAX6EUB8_IRIPA|nr:aluminum-activated malate transporter 10-like [Iris pallida]
MDSYKVQPCSTEWSVSVAEGSSVEVVDQRMGLLCRLRFHLFSLLVTLKSAISRFADRTLKIGADDPRKVVHSIKVGLALTLVSIFYYTRPLYDGVGGTSMWAILTVVVVFEFTVGGSLYKGFNRAIATTTAGALAFGIHWLARKSGETSEHIIIGTSVFIITSAATFFRFVPSIKAKFDYGMMIFVLTFNLISTSSYRVVNLIALAQNRVSTITLGVCITLIVCIVVFPVWAGEDLHLLIIRNMGKLADSIEATVFEYFEEETSQTKDASSQNSQGFKCVLNSKQSEDSLANLARWEPSHGPFSFRHPWSQYLKIGAAMRHCAYCIEALYGCIHSEIQATVPVKKHLSNVCTNLSLECSKVLKEAANSIKTMKASSAIEVMVADMNYAVEGVHGALRTLPQAAGAAADHSTDQEKEQVISTAPVLLLMEALPLVSVSSLLIEISARIEEVVDAVEDLAELAGFATNGDVGLAETKQSNTTTPSLSEDEDMRAIQQV